MRKTASTCQNVLKPLILGPVFYVVFIASVFDCYFTSSVMVVPCFLARLVLGKQSELFSLWASKALNFGSTNRSRGISFRRWSTRRPSIRSECVQRFCTFITKNYSAIFARYCPDTRGVWSITHSSANGKSAWARRNYWYAATSGYVSNIVLT
jgi:hypothetical protein